MNLRVVDPSLRASCAPAKFVHPCTARQVTFLCLSKEKLPKKRPPPSLRRPTVLFSLPRLRGRVREGAVPCGFGATQSLLRLKPGCAILGAPAQRRECTLSAFAKTPLRPRSRRARDELAGGSKTHPLGLEHRLAKPRVLPCGARLALGGFNCNHPRKILL